MLYGKYPYDIFAYTKMVPEYMQDPFKLMMVAPEEWEAYGDGRVMRILNRIISVCMATKE